MSREASRFRCPLRFPRTRGFSYLVETVRPRLHHSASLGEMFGVVVTRTHFVSGSVSQLAFDRIRVPRLLLIQEGRRHAPESMRFRNIAGVAELTQCLVESVLADYAFRRPEDREEKAGVIIRTSLQLVQDRHRLLTQGHDVRGGRLHPLRWDPPLRLLKTDLVPFTEAQLERSQDDERSELQCAAGLDEPRIAINGEQELADFLRIGDRRVMGCDNRRECIPHGERVMSPCSARPVACA